MAEDHRLLNQRRDHEVEVPPCKRGANPLTPTLSQIGKGSVSGKNRIDQRMPPEFVTDSFLPSEQAQGATGFKKTLLLESKTGRQRPGQDKCGDTGISCLYWEGLSFFDAKSFNRHARACLFCFP